MKLAKENFWLELKRLHKTDIILRRVWDHVNFIQPGKWKLPNSYYFGFGTLFWVHEKHI